MSSQIINTNLLLIADSEKKITTKYEFSDNKTCHSKK